jgi:hypothetical protein
MLTAAIQSREFHCPAIKHRHTTSLWTGDRWHRRSLASFPSPRHHLTTKWPHRRRATTSIEHFWRQTRLYGSKSNKFWAPEWPYTAILLPGNQGHTSQLPYGSKWYSPSTICHTKAQKQQLSWSHSFSYGQTCRRIAAPGHRLARPTSAPRSPATQLIIGRLHSAFSPFPAQPHRPSGAHSNTSKLHVLPNCSRTLHALARTHHHLGYYSRNRITCRIARLNIPL